MQISKQKVNPALEKQIAHMWYQLIVDTTSLEEAEKMFSDLLSKTELAAISKRLAVGYWLTKNRSYENIKDNLKVSSATIATVQQDMKLPGWKMAIQKIMADEWATVWEKKIKDFLKSKRSTR